MAINEAGIHGPQSLTIRRSPMDEDGIHRELAIPGFKILLPKSWHSYGTARIIVYVSTDTHAQIINTNTDTADLPLLSMYAKWGAEAKTIFNFFYREFTGGVSGLKTTNAQADRLYRLLGGILLFICRKLQGVPREMI